RFPTFPSPRPRHSQQSHMEPEALLPARRRKGKGEWIRVRKYAGEGGLPPLYIKGRPRTLQRISRDFPTNFPVPKFPPLFLIRPTKNHREGYVSTVKLTVNGKAVSVDVEDRTLLVHLLRDHLNLTGTHVGCDTSQCGACVVHMDGRAVKSCTMLAGQAPGPRRTTIAGLDKSHEHAPIPP